MKRLSVSFLAAALVAIGGGASAGVYIANKGGVVATFPDSWTVERRDSGGIIFEARPTKGPSSDLVECIIGMEYFENKKNTTQDDIDKMLSEDATAYVRKKFGPEAKISDVISKRHPGGTWSIYFSLIDEDEGEQKAARFALLASPTFSATGVCQAAPKSLSGYTPVFDTIFDSLRISPIDPNEEDVTPPAEGPPEDPAEAPSVDGATPVP